MNKNPPVNPPKERLAAREAKSKISYQVDAMSTDRTRKNSSSSTPTRYPSSTPTKGGLEKYINSVDLSSGDSDDDKLAKRDSSNKRQIEFKDKDYEPERKKRVAERQQSTPKGSEAKAKHSSSPTPYYPPHHEDKNHQKIPNRDSKSDKQKGDTQRRQSRESELYEKRSPKQQEQMVDPTKSSPKEPNPEKEHADQEFFRDHYKPVANNKIDHVSATDRGLVQRGEQKYVLVQPHDVGRFNNAHPCGDVTIDSRLDSNGRMKNPLVVSKEFFHYYHLNYQLPQFAHFNSSKNKLYTTSETSVKINKINRNFGQKDKDDTKTMKKPDVAINPAWVEHLQHGDRLEEIKGDRPIPIILLSETIEPKETPASVTSNPSANNSKSNQAHETSEKTASIEVNNKPSTSEALNLDQGNHQIEKRKESSPAKVNTTPSSSSTDSSTESSCEEDRIIIEKYLDKMSAVLQDRRKVTNKKKKQKAESKEKKAKEIEELRLKNSVSTQTPSKDYQDQMIQCKPNTVEADSSTPIREQEDKQTNCKIPVETVDSSTSPDNSLVDSAAVKKADLRKRIQAEQNFLEREIKKIPQIAKSEKWSKRQQEVMSSIRKKELNTVIKMGQMWSDFVKVRQPMIEEFNTESKKGKPQTKSPHPVPVVTSSPAVQELPISSTSVAPATTAMDTESNPTPSMTSVAPDTTATDTENNSAPPMTSVTSAKELPDVSKDKGTQIDKDPTSETTPALEQQKTDAATITSVTVTEQTITPMTTANPVTEKTEPTVFEVTEEQSKPKAPTAIAIPAMKQADTLIFEAVTVTQVEKQFFPQETTSMIHYASPVSTAAENGDSIPLVPETTVTPTGEVEIVKETPLSIDEIIKERKKLEGVVLAWPTQDTRYSYLNNDYLDEIASAVKSIQETNTPPLIIDEGGKPYSPSNPSYSPSETKNSTRQSTTDSAIPYSPSHPSMDSKEATPPTCGVAPVKEVDNKSAHLVPIDETSTTETDEDDLFDKYLAEAMRELTDPKISFEDKCKVAELKTKRAIRKRKQTLNSWLGAPPKH